MHNENVKILFVLHNLEIGGAQKVITQLIKYLDGTYFVPVLVYNFSANMLLVRAIPPKIFVYFFPFRDSEIGEFLFSLAILFFMVTNYFSNKS